MLPTNPSGIHSKKFFRLALAVTFLAGWGAATSFAQAVISNGTVKLGVNRDGSLNVPQSGSGIVGLRYVPNNLEATSDGCTCEGWGAADKLTGVVGGANTANYGTVGFNIVVESFTADASTAKSVVRIGSKLRVTHSYHPSPSPNLYQVDVTIENISSAPIEALYRRAMDWDIRPTPFSEYVTIVTTNPSTGTKPAAIMFTSDNGFANSNVLTNPGQILFTGEATDSGPADHGAVFDFNFGMIDPSAKKEFRTFYGAAGTETDALNAIAAVGAEAYSLGQSSTVNGPTLGTPATFVFGFTGVGGTAVIPAVDTTTTVISSGSPSYVGDSVTFTATVTANDATIPPGTVQFKVDGSNIGAAVPLDGAGNAQVSTSSLTAGAHSVTAEYSGGTAGSGGTAVNYKVSSSEPIIHEVIANRAPTPLDDTVTVDEDSGANTLDVFGNDSDPDNDTLSISSFTQGAHGSVSLSSGALVYTPDPNYNGPDTFSYTISDGRGGSAAAVVNVTVNAVNDAPTLDAIGNKTTDEGVALTFTATGNDDFDNPNPNSLSFSLVGAPTGATITAAGVFSWTPTEAQGPGEFTFRVRVTDTGTPARHDDEEIKVTVREVNAAPVLDPIGSKSGFWGNALTFTATATDSDLPANTLTYSLAGAPDGASITGAGVFTWTPTSAQLGTHTFTVLVTDNGSPSLSDNETITITIGRRPTTLVYSGALAGQYSDSVMLAAALADSGGGAMQGTLLAGKAINFTLGSQGASEATNTSGVAGKSLTLTQAAQTLNVVSQFGGDLLYQPSGDSDPFTINKEDAETDYTGDSLVFTAGPNIGTASSVRLAARLTQRDSELGDLTLARVRFELYKFNSSTTPTFTFGNIAVNASGDAETTVALPVDDAYTVRVVIEAANGYWRANPAGEGTLVVAYGSTERRVTGGGWVTDAASANNKGNFGFTVNYRNNGSPRGNALYLFRGADGYNYRVKSNSWQGGGLTFYGDPWKAAFSGKCNVQKIDPITGATVESWGNYTFTVDLVDGDLKNPRETDRYAIQVLTDASAIWRQIGTRTAPVALGGGNVAVKSN